MLTAKQISEDIAVKAFKSIMEEYPYLDRRQKDFLVIVLEKLYPWRDYQ